MDGVLALILMLRGRMMPGLLAWGVSLSEAIYNIILYNTKYIFNEKKA
jgi:hypothetical protein